MHILLLGINYWPEQTGIGAFNTWRAEYLASRGYQVTVCTGFPYYPEWKIPAEYSGRLVAREKRNGVTILRSWLWVPQRVTSIRRVLHEASFLASSFIRALCSHKPDLLFVASPPLGLGIVAFILSRLWRVPYVFDVEDLQPDSAADLGMLPKSVLPVLYGLEKFAYKHAALISTLTEGMRRRIIAKGVPEAKVAIFPPRTSDDYFKVAEEDGNEFRKEHGLAGKFVVTHSGNMGVKQGLHVLLDAAALLRKNTNITFLLVGDGAMRSELQDRARTLQLPNLRFLPLQSEEKFLQLLGATDLALITQQKTVSDIAFPSKTVTLLSSGLPVLASVNASSAIAQVVQASGAGRVLEPEDAALLAQSVEELSKDRVQCVQMKTLARTYALTQWSPDRVLPLMEDQFLKVFGSSARAQVDGA